MLIRSLRAENFMKFESLCLENFPRVGVIGIEGANESGKSTIAEAIFFAFFGRSGSGKLRPVEELIRWGADQMRIEVEFLLGESAQGRGGDEFLMAREIDRFGTNYVKILSLPDRREVAAGHIEVQEFIRGRFKFDAREFRLSFYFNQVDHCRAIASSEPLLDFVDRMTGAAHLSAAVSSIKREIGQLEREFAHYQKDIGRNLRQIERYSQNYSRLPDLEESVRDAIAQHENLKKEMSDLTAVLESRRRLIGEREACERQLTQLAAAKEPAASAGVDELLGRYGKLGGADEETQRCHEDHRDQCEEIVGKLQELKRLFAGYRELCGLIDGEKERNENALGKGESDSLASQRIDAERQRLHLGKGARRSRAGMVAASCLVVALACVAGLASYLPAAGDWAGWLELDSQLIVQVPGCIALVGLLLFATLVCRWKALRRREREVGDLLLSLEKRIAAAESDRELLSRLEQLRDQGRMGEFLGKARMLSRGPAARRVAEFEREHSGVLGAGRDSKRCGYSKIFSSLAQRERQARDRLQSRVQSDSRTIKGLEARLRKARSERDRFENEIRECRSQIAKKEAVEEKNYEFEKSAGATRENIEDRRCACRLLEDTKSRIRLKLGPTVANLVRTILPYLTDHRYQDVKVGENLEFEVYSREKSDFVSAGDLSGGTNEALMLALRLAFSQAFVAARLRRPQLVLFDEPFRMLDVDRALEALGALRKLSPDLLQFFVIQPNYTKQQRRAFDCLISTSIAAKRLEVSLARARGAEVHRSS